MGGGVKPSEDMKLGKPPVGNGGMGLVVPQPVRGDGATHEPVGPAGLASREACPNNSRGPRKVPLFWENASPRFLPGIGPSVRLITAVSLVRSPSSSSSREHFRNHEEGHVSSLQSISNPPRILMGALTSQAVAL